ncbi:MAG: type I-E CRISPR-associated protein Cas6/Cse3/CasE [Gallionella sp.]
MDFVVPKPATLQGYALHRIAAELADGAKILFADGGDHLLLRTDKPLALPTRPLRTLNIGDIIGFELRACVSKKVKGLHRYFPTSDWQSRHDWLARQGERHGFNLITVNCSAAMQPIQAGQRSFTLDQTDFTGVLKITQLEHFNHALNNGIGNTGQAFGFGLLII